MDPSIADAAALGWRHPLALHAILAVLALWPLARIFCRAGFNPAWSALVLVPFVGLALAGSALVFQKWPHLPEPLRPQPKPRRETA